MSATPLHPDYVETRDKVAAAREAQIKKMAAEIDRLQAQVADLRQRLRSVKEAIQHFVKLIDRGQEPWP